MLRYSVRRGTRVPWLTHVHSTARIKWATYTFWHLLDPLLRRHFVFARRRAQLDRLLEKNSFMTNCVIGLILGVAAYTALLRRILPPIGAKEETSMAESAGAIMTMIDMDSTKEIPAFKLLRVKREVMGKIYAVADVAELRQQRNEVARMKEALEANAT